MKKFTLVHGWEGSPTGNWFPWLQSALEKQGHIVIALEMPNAFHPVQDEWVTHLKKSVGTPDTDTILIGHSLGGIAILRYLERLAPEDKVGSIALVASFPQSVGIPELASFFETSLDYAAVKSHISGSILAFQSQDDPYVPFENGILLRDELGAKLITIEHGGHLNANNGYTEFPTLLNELQSLL